MANVQQRKTVELVEQHHCMDWTGHWC